MTTLTTAEAWLLLATAWSVLVGFGLAVAAQGWLDRRRATRRLAAAETAYWVSLRAFVERAREGIDATPKRSVGQIASVARMREQIADNECRRLRADLDQWNAQAEGKS